MPNDKNCQANIKDQLTIQFLFQNLFITQEKSSNKKVFGGKKHVPNIKKSF
jgi:hypothetical protein